MSSLICKCLLLLAFFFKTNQFYLLTVAPRYAYKDGKRLNEIIGYLYTVVNTETYETISVFVEQSTPLISQQELEELKDSGKKIFVQFDNAVVKPYYSERTHSIEDSIKADSVSFCKDSEVSK